MDKTLELLYERYQATYEKWRTAPDYNEDDVIARIELWEGYTRARDAYESYNRAKLSKNVVTYLPVVTVVQ